MLTRRAAIAAYYDNALVGVRRCVKPLITLAGQCLHTYVVRACLRDSAREYLGSCGIETQPFQAMPLHLHPGFAFLGYRGGQARRPSDWRRKRSRSRSTQRSRTKNWRTWSRSWRPSMTDTLCAALCGISDEAGVSLEDQVRAQSELGGV